MTRLPTKTREALVVLAMGSVVTDMVTGQTEFLDRSEISCGEVVEFLKKLEHSQSIASVQQVRFLFKNILFEGSDVFESSVCLVSSVKSDQWATRLAID